MSGKRIRRPNRRNDFVYETIKRKNLKKRNNQSRKDGGNERIHPKKKKVNREKKKLLKANQLDRIHPEPSNVLPAPNQSPNPSTSPPPSPPPTPPPSPTMGRQRTPVQSDGQSEESETDEEVNKAINKIYTSFNSGAAFSAGIENFIRRKRSLNMHRQQRKIFSRRRFVTHQPNDTIMADLVFYEGSKRANDNHKYILTGNGLL